jgi:glycosyltransferase involved in cell wall biosynthesis
MPDGSTLWNERGLGPDNVVLAFVGILGLDGPDGTNPAYSTAGALFQERLLETLPEAGIDVSHVFSLRPVPSFPADRRIVFAPAAVTLFGRYPGTLLPFLNLGPLKPLSSGLALLTRLVKWAWILRARPHRAILVYNLASPPGIISVLVGRLTRTKVFALVADIQVPGSGLVPNSFARRLEFGLLTWTLPMFDGLIVLTRRIAEDFAPNTPFLQMEGAVPEELADVRTDPPDTVTPKADGAFVIMYAGGLSDLKGIPLLLDAFALLAGPKYRLWITGAGPLRGRVERAATEDPRIVYWGFPTYARVRELYREASVLVNPHSTTHLSSRYLFPSKLIEYLATGTPVISTCSTPEVNEEFRDVLYTLEPESVEGLAALLQRIAGLPLTERTSVGARAQRLVRAKKTWQAQSRRIAEFMRGAWRSADTDDRPARATSGRINARSE